jgi:hypothetical protein
MRIFISYSSKDRPLVEILAEDLKVLDHEVWFDQALTGGENWWRAILDHIRIADLFVCALTSDWLTSGPSKLEFQYGLALNRHMLPVEMVPVNVRVLPSAVQRLQIVNYIDQNKQQFISLLKALKTLPPTLPLPQPLPPEPAIPLSPFASLRDRMDAATLPLEEQQDLVNDFQVLLVQARSENNQADLADASEWLRIFGQRLDLLRRA